MMNIRHRMSMLHLFSIITIVTALNSNINERDNKYQQELFSGLIGTMRELTPAIDDSDTRFEPGFRTEKEYSSVEDSRSNDLQDNVISISVIIPEEKILSRQERSVTWMFGSTQTPIMDGSGTELEGSTSESVTDTTQFVTTSIQLNLTSAPTVSSAESTTLLDLTSEHAQTTTTTTAFDQTSLVFTQTQASTETVTYLQTTTSQLFPTQESSLLSSLSSSMTTLSPTVTDSEVSGNTEISSTMSSTLPSSSSTTMFSSTVPTSIATDTITQISFETSQSSSIGGNTISLTQFPTTTPSSTLTSMSFTEIETTMGTGFSVTQITATTQSITTSTPVETVTSSISSISTELISSPGETSTSTVIFTSTFTTTPLSTTTITSTGTIAFTTISTSPITTTITTTSTILTTTAPTTTTVITSTTTTATATTTTTITSTTTATTTTITITTTTTITATTSTITSMITTIPTTTSTTTFTSPTTTATITTSILTTSISTITTSTSMITITISTTSTTTSTTTTTTSVTTGTTLRPPRCEWTNWVPTTNCTSACGNQYRQLSRSCVDRNNDNQICAISRCGNDSNTMNQTCQDLPSCPTQNVTLQNTSRDPNIRISSYVLPNSMYFFDRSYRRIWISSKGYISFDTPYYSQTMTSAVFRQILNQAIAAPLWANLIYDTNNSLITVNWFSSIDGNESDANTYNTIIQNIIRSTCPTRFCSLNFDAARIVQVRWQNLTYESPATNQSLRVSFSAFLINTYDSQNMFSPVLRSYIAFDYTGLSGNLGDRRPFVGYRANTNFIQILNDPSSSRNAVFLTSREIKGFYVGGRYLSPCEVTYLREIRLNILYPTERLNDEINNPRIPCPCTYAQALVDGRYARLFSETSYELSQSLVCFAPMTIQWIWWNRNFKLLRSQTCCYNWRNQALITSGALAGSVLQDLFLPFQPNQWLRRIQFRDSCCSPSYTTGLPNWNLCQLYFQLRPPSTCTGYQAPTIVTGLGDPHMTTIDNGRYTCHIQGLYIFAQTTAAARTIADSNQNSNLIDSNRIYPDDLFQIYVRSVNATPALNYIERTQGYGSIFSSYTIMMTSNNRVFNINNENGKFGFTTNEGISLTRNLSIYAVYDYTNLNITNTSEPGRYIYRVQQNSRTVLNRTIPQLTLTVWSGLSIRCQVLGENLDCTLILPTKYKTYIEGLVGNFNDDYSDDLVNRETNQTVSISNSANFTLVNNDEIIVNACRSWKVPGDPTPHLSFPIMPTRFVDWYNRNASTSLASLNRRLNPTVVNETCGPSFECVHDYLIRINEFTSRATGDQLRSFEESRTTLAETPPTLNISSDVRIELPIGNGSRAYRLPISISGSYRSVMVNINSNGSITNTSFNGNSIIVPMPNNTHQFVEVSITISYGKSSILIQNLDITACLCGNGGTCQYDEITTISTYYKRASCSCLDVYEGDLCELPYNGCRSDSACKVNWNNNTTCIAKSASEQQSSGRAYTCLGTCMSGYRSLDNFTCDDIDECTENPSICGPGQCINQIGNYACNCTTGYRFGNGTCIDINECIEPNTDGTFPRRCNNSELCTNTNGNYACTCNPVFNTTGVCVYDPALCDFPNNDTCVVNGTVICLHSTINENGTCHPWCRSSCPNFCQLINDTYRCNCMKEPGYQISIDGKRCDECDALSYGYGCNESCQCVYGQCNRNATNVNESCSCNSGYEQALCDRLADVCASNNTCNSTTENCLVNPNDGSITCSCKNGFEKNDTSTVCTDIDECARGLSTCDPDSSTCDDTFGSYTCTCKSGYQPVDGTCQDINECLNSSSCVNYTNTYCTNIQGTYECRCLADYSVGGDQTRIYENIRGTNNSCLRTNLSINCIDACQLPAVCNSITGQCQCLTLTPNLIPSPMDDRKQTCTCPGYPYINFDNETCDTSSTDTWLLVYFNQIPSETTGRRRRSFDIYSPEPSTLEAEIYRILITMNKTSNNSILQITRTNNTALASIEVFVALNLSLNATERIQLINGLFNRGVSLNSSYTLTIRMIIDQASKKLEIISNAQPRCQECVYLHRGACSLTNNDTCSCFTGYDGNLCHDEIESPPLQTTSSNNWTVPVAVVSAIAGLLLIIALVLAVLYIISRRSRQRAEIREIRLSTSRPAYVIPRVHLPSAGTVGHDISFPDVFSLPALDERYNETSDSNSTTIYDPSYRTHDVQDEANFGIFDDLERSGPMGRRRRLQMEMSSFSDADDNNDTELVTEMVDDMTKNDDLSDDFIEAMNFNLVIPRANV